MLDTDIDNQNINNYVYDKIGNLIHDKSEEIDTIKWTVYGKVSKVIRADASSKDNIEYLYDAMGK